MKREALRIDWIDSTSWGDQWLAYDIVNEKEIKPITSRGEVVRVTPTAIFLAQSVDNEQCHNIIAIPKGCILKKRKIP